MFRINAASKSVAVAVLVLLGASTAQANDDVSVSLGLRAWNSQWQANSFPTVRGAQVAAHADSNTKLTTIPIVSIRYKDFALSASSMLEASYTLSDGIEQPFDEKRSEVDVNLSYAVIPGLAASLGLKEVRWGTVVINGPTVGLSGSAPIGSGLGMYGTGGIGWLDTKIPGYETLKTDYLLGEFGVTYSFATSSQSLKGLTATLGYRFQKITAKSFPNVNYRDVNDITSGMTIGLIGRF